MTNPWTKIVIGATAFLAMLSYSSLAGVEVQFSSPVVVDTDTEIFPAADMTNLQCFHAVDICEGPDFNLLFMDGPVLTFLRIDKHGNLIDTIPRVHRDPELTYSYFNKFVYVSATWCDPYFYVFESRRDTLFYTRLSADLTPVDDAPTMLAYPYKYGDRLYADGCNLWIARRNLFMSNSYQTRVYTLPDVIPAFDSVGITSYGTASWYTAVSDGFFLVVANDESSVFECTYVSDRGDVTVFPPVSYGHFESFSLRGINLIPCGTDSVLFYGIDRVTDPAYFILYYFVLTPTQVSDPAPLKNLAIPKESSSVALFARRGIVYDDNLIVPGMYYYNQTVSAYLFHVDIVNDTVLGHGRISSEHVEPDLSYLQMMFDSDSVYWFLSSKCSISRLPLPKTNPLGYGEGSSVYYTTANLRTPTLLQDDSGLLLSMTHSSPSGSVLKTIRFNDPIDLSSHDSLTVVGGDSLVYRPWLYDLGEFKGLSWLGAMMVDSGNLSFTQKFTAFAGDTLFLDTFVDFGLVNRRLWRLQEFKPSVWLHSTGAVINIATRADGNDYGNGTSNRLYSIGLPNWQDTQLRFEYESGGQVAVCDWGDSALFVGTDVYVTAWNEWGFPSAYAGNYKGYSLRVESEVYASQIQPITSGIDWCPLDLFSAKMGNQQVLSLRCNDDLVTVDPSDGSFQPLFDLWPYTWGGYLDAGGFDRGALIPIETKDYYVVVLQGGHLHLTKLLIFDKTWTFLDSARIHFEGVLNEVSEFVYLPEDDALVFAYSAWLPHPYGSNRVVVQSAQFLGTTSVGEDDSQIPHHFALSQNYPNPFNPTTEISFSLPYSTDVKLQVFNVLGQNVATLVDRHLEAGNYSITWDGRKAASGVYLYRLTADEFIETRKMILIK